MKFDDSDRKKRKDTVTCPNCKKDFDIEYSITVTDDDSRKEAFLIANNDKYFSHKCPHCKAKVLYNRPLRYIADTIKLNGDEYGQWDIMYFPSKEVCMDLAKKYDLEKEENSDEIITSYRRRVVWDYDDFKDKIFCVLNYMDDRVIETMKDMIAFTFYDEYGKKVVQEHIVQNKENQLGFNIMFSDKSEMIIPITKEGYEQALDFLMGSTCIMDNDNDYIVNPEMIHTKDLSSKGYKPIHKR